MKIYNEEKTQELDINTLDLENGYLMNDRKVILHHEATEARDAVYIDRPEKLSNGSTQIWKDLVSPAIEAKDAWDEYEEIQVYKLYTEEEYKDRLRSKRVKLLTAFDKYKSNVDYGIERETEMQHKNMIAWYQDLLNLEEIAFDNVPERIKYYL